MLKKLAQQTALYGLSSIAARLLTFVVLTPYLTRKFLPDQLGIHTELYAWAAFLIIPFTYRMETALFRFGSQKEDLPRAFRVAALSILFSTLALVALLLVLAKPIAQLLEYPDLSHYVIWIILIIGLDALSAIPFALLRLQGKALKFASIKMFNIFVYLGLLIFMLEGGPYFAAQNMFGAQYWYDPSIGIGYVFVANLLANALMLLFLIPSYFTVRRISKEAPFFDTELWKKMMIYALPLVVAAFAGIINEVLDRTLLKVFLVGDLHTRLTQVGIYGACYKISIFMHLFTQAFNYAAEPFFFKNANKEGSKQLYADVALLFSIIGSIAFLGIMLFMDIVQYFVDAPYRAGIVIVPILLMANLFLGLYYNVAVWYKLADKTRYGAYIAFVGAFVTIVGNITLIPYLGYVGAAWATLACYLSMVLLGFYWGQKHFPIPYAVSKILIYIGLALGLYLVYLPIKAQLTSHSIFAYALSAFTLLLYLGIVWKREGKNIRQIIKR